MCWFNDDKPIRKVADKDIIVFKVFNKSRYIYKNKAKVGIHSLIMYFTYMFTALYEQEPLKVESYIRYSRILNKYPNLYKYSLLVKIILKLEILFKTAVMGYTIRKGFNSYTVKALRRELMHRMSSISSLVVHKCIIPKGATYYINDLGEIISDKIIVTGKVVSTYGKEIRLQDQY